MVKRIKRYFNLRHSVVSSILSQMTEHIVVHYGPFYSPTSHGNHRTSHSESPHIFVSRAISKSSTNGDHFNNSRCNCWNIITTLDGINSSRNGGSQQKSGKFLFFSFCFERFAQFLRIIRVILVDQYPGCHLQNLPSKVQQSSSCHPHPWETPSRDLSRQSFWPSRIQWQKI